MKPLNAFLPRELPAGLEALGDLAMDLRWTWSHAGDALWTAMDPEIWAHTDSAYVLLENLSDRRLKELAEDPRFRAELDDVVRSRKEYLSRSCWGDSVDAGADVGAVAYFSMEFGLGKALPLYAGGLGVLAGDHLRAASDLGIPLVGVGLLYQEGYFRQAVDQQGWQIEAYPYNDPSSLPVSPVAANSGGWLHVSLDFPGRSVRFRIWQAQVGRVKLYLLDSNDPMNSPSDRGITSKLYGGGPELRLVQEIALGIGGWLTLDALEIRSDVCHLNEGHAAFVTLERARHFMLEHGVNFWEALWATRAGNAFTTHTPVAAAFDTFPAELLVHYGREYAERLRIEPTDLLALGRLNSSDDEPFNMAYLAARTCATTNGVSQLHGEVSRRIFSDLYPRWPTAQTPVGHITNGVHVPSWDSLWADRVWTEACGKERWLGTLETLSGAIEGLSDDELWSFRGRERGDLVDYARKRLALQLGQRGADRATIDEAQTVLDANALTLGFARRFTEYKRPNLLLTDRERLVRLLTDTQRPVQLIIAGKAHPDDELGKTFVHEWMEFVQGEEVRAHAVFLVDYDMALAQEMVQGVDVWINTPRRPWEACGTSGMKVLVNGGLNLSELDGWWAEAYQSELGWALGDGREHDEPGWDAVEAEQLYTLLEEEVIPQFYDRDAKGIPRAWVTRMRVSMARLAPQFSSNRMLREYVEQIYRPAGDAYRRRSENNGAPGRALYAWERLLRQHWGGIHFGELEAIAQGNAWLIRVAVYLGDVEPDAVRVELYADPRNGRDALREVMQRGSPIPGAVNGYVYQAKAPADRGLDEMTPCVKPYHPEVRIPAELPLISWQR